MSEYVLILPLLNVCLVHTTVNMNYMYPNNFVCPVFSPVFILKHCIHTSMFTIQLT